MNIIALMLLVVAAALSIILPIYKVRKILLILFGMCLVLSTISSGLIGLLSLVICIILVANFLIWAHLTKLNSMLLGVLLTVAMTLCVYLRFFDVSEILASALYVWFLSMFIKGFVYET